MTYSFKGKQYVAVAAGSNVVAFGLHDGLRGPEGTPRPVTLLAPVS